MDDPSTVNALLVPASVLPVFVAVSVKDPVFEIVTLCVESTPAVKDAVVPLPEDNVPVELTSTVPTNPVTVLLFASRAVTLISNDVPAVCVPIFPPPDASTKKLSKAPGLTVKLLLVPASVLPVFVAVIVNEPVFEIVTLWVERTPAVKEAVVPLPDDNVPVELTSTVPVNPVTVLLFASRAVTLMSNTVPAVCVPIFPPPDASTKKLSNAPGLTVKLLLVPASVLPVFVAVTVKEPVFEIVTLWVERTPAVKEAVVPLPEDNDPVELISTVPVNPVTVLLFASRAVTLISNAVPAVCVPIFPPPDASTKKLSNAPGLTVKLLLVPASVLPVFVAVTVKEPVFEIVTLWVERTPAVKEAVVPLPEDNDPVELISTVPVNPVIVLLFASRAVTLISNDVPAVCVPIFPPPDASTKKLSNAPGLTANELLVPASVLPVFVAVIVNEPVFEIVTLCVESTPAVKDAVVPLPEDNVPVELTSTVPTNPVTVLLFASRAVTLISNDVPAVCVPIFPPPDASTKKLSKAPGLTVKLLLVPASVLPVFVAVIVNEPVFEIVTLWVERTPAVKEAVVPLPEDNDPVELISTVPVNPVIVLLFASRAVTLISNDVPAVCVPIFPPPDASTKKLSNAPGLTANELLVPASVLPVFVAVIVNEPVFEIVTLCVESTPAVKDAVVPLPEDNVPVELTSTVPTNPVTVLLFASRAVTLISNDVPAVCVPIFPPPDASTKKLSKAPGLTVKLLLVPASVLPVFVAVIVNEPVFEIVTLWVERTPAVKEAVVPLPEDNDPVELISTVPVNPVIVLLFASRAVTLISNDVPAVCVPIFPPPDASTKKLSNAPGLTANELLVPASVLPVFVAVIVNEPVFEIVTLCVESTPAVKDAVVPLPEDNVPVELTSTVPTNPVTVLLFASRAVTLISNDVPAVCVPIFPPPDASTKKLSKAPGLTVKLLLVPASVLPVFVAVIVNEPVFEIVTLWVERTPAVKEAVVPLPEDNDPVELISTVPVNPVTVLLFASRAVTLISNAVPAVCVPIFPPPDASTKKLSNAPGLTVNELLVPASVLPVFVAVIVNEPVFEIVTL